MGEIKFRAWINEKMEYDPISDNKESINDFFKRFELWRKFHIMQYTGLTDKNGKPIYEGDVVKAWYEDYPDEYQIGKVWWFNCYYPAFDIYIPNKSFATGFEAFHDDYNAFSCPDLAVEVIGNIYENPELLERK